MLMMKKKNDVMNIMMELLVDVMMIKMMCTVIYVVNLMLDWRW